MVQPSPSAKSSRAIWRTDLSAKPGSRCLMNQQFSAKRQASK